MTITLNGAPADARGAESIEDLVRLYALPPLGILIEHNGTALHRREWPNKSLTEGDSVEFIRVVAGG